MNFWSIPERAAAYCGALRPWQRALAAFLAGSLCCLGLPPLGWFPVLWIGLPLLVWLLSGATSARQAFVTGWCFAFGYFLFGLYWIAASMFVDLERFGWLIPVTVTGLPAGLSLLYGLAALICHKLQRRGIVGALTLAWCLAATEYVRGFLLTGFPWNLFGYIWTEYLPVAQSVSLFGSYGLTFATLSAAVLPATLAAPGKRAALLANGLAIGSFLVLGGWGTWRLQTPVHTTPDVYLRLVQPNIAQNLKWDPQERAGNFAQLLDMTALPSDRPLTHIIWPETAVTYFLADDAPHRLRISAVLPEGATLLTGAPRQEHTPSGDTLYFNALVTLDRSGMIGTSYDKFHLVPFGEFVPFRSFGPIAAVTAGLGAFTAGPGPRSLHVPGLPAFSPLICYEVIFPHEVIDPHDQPRLLINITNDAWYGKTSGPYQHLAIARMRAIEEGLPLIRVANTGISAVIDPYGRTLQSLPLETKGNIDTTLPEAVAALTINSGYGKAIFLILWVFSGILLFYIGKRP
ncbi:MAG: apolipoprotein N-acyltransferase [Alphaproteobacteria bacterium]